MGSDRISLDLAGSHLALGCAQLGSDGPLRPRIISPPQRALANSGLLPSPARGRALFGRAVGAVAAISGEFAGQGVVVTTVSVAITVVSSPVAEISD